MVEWKPSKLNIHVSLDRPPASAFCTYKFVEMLHELNRLERRRNVHDDPED